MFKKKKKSRSLSLLLMFALLLNIVFVPAKNVQAATTPAVYYTLSSDNINVGDSFTIFVNVNNVSDLYGASFDFLYDNSILQITSVEQGSIFTGSGKTIINPVDNSSNNSGSLSYALLVQGNTTGINVDSAGGSLIKIHAKALKEGSITLKTISDNSDLLLNGNNARVQLSDSNGDAIAYSGIQNAVTINGFKPLNDEITSDTMPGNMIAGQTYNANITVKNTGTNTWTAANGYYLYAVETGSFTFSKRAFSLDTGDSIAPGQSKTFTVSLTAPAAPGSYSASFQMLCDGVAFFGPILQKTVSVALVPDNAEITSNNIPDSMTAGQSYNVNITVKNTGSNTWTAANGYYLYAVDTGSFTFSKRAIPLDAGDSIAPGQSKAFTFTMMAPSTAGSYTASLQMLHDGAAWFGSTLQKTVSVTAAAIDDAAFTSDDIPADMNAGQTYDVNITVKNTGTTTWTAANGYYLYAVNAGSFTYSKRAIPLNTDESIAPGQSKTFTVTIKAPNTSGSYTTSLQMLHDGVAFFGNTLQKSAVVAAATDSASITSDDMPGSMNAGQSYDVNITVKNTGTTAWTAADGYYLYAVDAGSFTYLKKAIPLNADESIAPGQSKTFTVAIKAPNTSGSYDTSLQMLHDGVAFFGTILQKTVTVAAATDNASITSDDIPGTMVAGQSYNVNITVKNTGTTTWTAADGYYLYAVDAGSFTYLKKAIPLNADESIAPGQSKTFTVTIKAPNTSGSYDTSLQMLHDGVAFFGTILQKTVTVAVATDNASITSDDIPGTMVAGQSYNVNITVENTGTTTWTAADGYYLYAVNTGSLTYSKRAVPLDAVDSITPGQSKTFTVTIKAPGTAGSYTTSLQMLHDGVAFFGNTLQKTVTVSAATDNASITSDDMPGTMTAGQSYNVNITVENTGTTTWTAADGYYLYAVNAGSFTYLKKAIPLNADESIAPGQSKTFTVTMTAPKAAGTYATSLQMLHDGVAFFGSVLQKSAAVAAATDNASFSSDNMPSCMVTGQSYNVNITVKNTGTSTWTSADGYYLYVVNTGSLTYSKRAVPLNAGESIAPGQSKTFTVTITAPSTAGSYTASLQMLHDGVAWFGDTLQKTVSVTNTAVDGASVITDDIPSTMTAGQSYNVTITVKNTGTSTWTAANGYYLYAVDTGSFTYSKRAVALDTSDSIYPGQTKTFTVTITAPAAAGSYTTSLQMLHDGVSWFGSVLQKSVTVTN